MTDAPQNPPSHEREDSNADTGQGGQAPPAARPRKPETKLLPPWNVLLHNDDINDMEDVVETITMLTPLGQSAALDRMKEAHDSGVALLLTTHQERAELYVQQFGSRNLTVTAEPAD